MEEEPKKSINIDYYIEMLLKRRWCIIVPLCISLIVGITLSIRLPRSYMTSTLIMVEPQRVPSKYVQPLVDSDIEERVVTLQEQVLSQTNLEEIINKFNMFSGKEYSKMFLEDKVGSLRRRIIVKVTKARRGADAFSISFEGNNPELVMNVVNSLATSFIDKNLELRESKAIGTVEFLDGQLSDMRKKLTDVEERLKDYRKKYMGELPEQLGSNEKVLDRIQLRISDRNLALRDAKNRLLELDREEKIKLTLLDSQVGAMEQQSMSDIPMMSVIDKIGGKNGTAMPVLPKESEKVIAFNKLKEQYESASLRYTPRHPDVIKLKKMMTDLEAEVLKETMHRKVLEEKMKKENSENDDTIIPKDMKKNPFNDGIAKARASIKAEIQDKRDKITKEIAAIEEEIAKLETESKEYERRVDITPKREQEMMALTRDYSNIQKHYSELLNRKLEADIAMDMERRAKGEQFRVLDKARKPEKPIFPDVKKFLLIFLAAGLGVGIGIAFLLDFMDNTLKRAEDVEPLLDIPVLATIPKIYNQKDKKRRKINQIFTLASLLFAGALLAVFAILAIKGVDTTLDIAKKLIGKKI